MILLKVDVFSWFIGELVWTSSFVTEGEAFLRDVGVISRETRVTSSHVTGCRR